MSKDVDWNADKICLKDDDLSRLPYSTLEKLFLELPLQLRVLDLSNTSILSLPSSISSFRSLEEFFLRDCSALIELPSEIGMLAKLKLFDINGTELMYIPKEIGNLKDLEHLIVSLSQHADYYIKTKSVADIIPRMMISKLKKLKELRIRVNPEAKWWEEEVGAIQHELCDLIDLETLQWYLPTNKVLQQFLQQERNHLPIYASLSNFMLTIGQHTQLTSCLPHGLEKKFEELNKYLKWINGEESMDDSSGIMENVEALFLSRHWTCRKLLTLNIRKLKYCLLAECNEMKTLVEVDEVSNGLETSMEGGERIGLQMLEFLSIHYMKELQTIWKGPIGKDSLSKLKILTFHTCPSLTTIFTPSIAQNFSCLAELIIEDCPKVKSLISNESPNFKTGLLFPSLEKIFLLDLPELVNIFGGLIILERLDTLLVYHCLKVRFLSTTELPNIKVFKGESRWWNDLNCDKSKWKSVFVPLKENGDLMEQLFEATNSFELSQPEAKEEKPLDWSRLQTLEIKTSNLNFHLRKEAGLSHSQPLPEFRHLEIQLEDIIKATENFGPGQLIGRGGFGSVYKGELSYSEGRRTVAFKRLDRRLGQGTTEFWKDIMMLSKLKHKNLISLLHFCIEGDERILVYEYASHGSLDHYLGDASLTWKRRLKICIQVAHAINYLHESQPRVLHRDIKSSNILLDENWDAKVADFGPSKFGLANQPHTFLVSNAVGTMGYCDPLYHETGILSKESDVYSFGVVLFEVMCGKLCRQYGNNELLILVSTWKEYFVKKRVDDIIFHALKGEIDYNSLMTFSKIAYQCLDRDHKKRPMMIEIINKLELAFTQQTCNKTSLQLRFQANLPNVLFTNTRIESVDNTAVKLVLSDVNSDKIVSSGPFSSLKVEIVPLAGDFSADDEEGWSEKDFDAKVLYSRRGRRPIITGDLEVTLENGVANLRELYFTDSSSWMRSRKFMIGARVKDPSSGVRIREAITPAFIVKDQRGNAYEKHHPPSLGDEIWRLENIAKDGAFHRRLALHNISTVKDLLQMYATNQSFIRKLLGAASNNTWETIIKHANTCILDDQRYMYKCGADGMGLLLDSVLKVVGATFDGQNYPTLDKLSEAQMNMVEASKQKLYRDLDGRVPVDDPSVFGFLVPMPVSSLHFDPLKSASLSLQGVNVPVLL